MLKRLTNKVSFEKPCRFNFIFLPIKLAASVEADIGKSL